MDNHVVDIRSVGHESFEHSLALFIGEHMGAQMEGDPAASAEMVEPHGHADGSNGSRPHDIESPP